MTGPCELDADDIAAAAAALLSHLHRSGVAMMPHANEAATRDWQARMSRVASADVVNETASGAISPPRTSSPAETDLETSAPQNTAPKKSVRESIEAAAKSRLQPVPAAVTPTAESGQPYPVSLPIADREASLDQMAMNVAGCTMCGELSRCRTQTVFGEGNPEARFLFFGEGPGADEDRTGRPFVGRAGQLLTKMIEACKLSREEVYITNTVKCRPPDNRNPEHEEVEHCRPYFERQFEIIRPEYIICLGAVSARALLRTKLSIGRLRQRFHPYRDSKVVVIYHPAYLLRNPDAKKAAWADLQMLMADAGLR